MLIKQRPKISESRHHVCDFHKRYPHRRDYPGCTCMYSYSAREKTWDEMTEEERKHELDPFGGYTDDQ